jgi:CzcA family heavy metal efflux pump
MMRSIIGSSLKYRLVVIAVAVALMSVGLWQLRDMPVDVLPEFTPPTVDVQTEALGLSAPEVEQMITVPMEQDLLNGVAWLDEIRSESVPGLSRIQLIFEPGTDIMRARQMVQERLAQAYVLPQVSKPPQMIQPLASSSRVMMVRLSSKDVSPIEMGVLTHWTIRPALMGVPGVADVAVWGQRERQLQVQVDPKHLQDQGVSLLEVIETTGNALWVSPLTFLEASTPGTGGFIDTANQRISIQHLLPVKTADDLSLVPVVNDNSDESPVGDHPLLLNDVAKVVEDHQPLIGDAVSTDDANDLFIVIEKFPDANTLDVTRGVDAALAALAPGLTGIDVDTSVYRPATFIETAIGNVGKALLVGTLLMALAIAVFSGWRSALISLIAIPLSIVAAVLVLHLRGMTFNTVLLAGLVAALGILVDDVVVNVDLIKQRLRQHRQAGESDTRTATVVTRAVLEARGPMIYAILIALLTLVPIYFIGFSDGLPNAFFGPIALSYALAILASLLVSLTVTPVLALLLFTNSSVERSEPLLVSRLQSGYDRLVTRTLDRQRLALGVAAILLVVTIIAFPLLRQSMLPSFQDRDLLIHWDSAPGTSLPEMDRITTLVSQELRSIPGVRDVGAHVGRAVTSDQSANVNAGELWVSLDPAANYPATVDALREVVDGYPGISHEVMTYPEERIQAALGGPADTMMVRLYGQDLDVLRTKGEEIRRLVAGVDGVVDAHITPPVEEPTVQVQVDLAKAQEVGVKPGDVRRSAAALLSGIEVGSLFDEQKVFQVVVWGAPETRHSLTSVRDLLIETHDGGHVRLGDVADVRVAPVLTDIRHEDVSRYLDVGVDVRGRDLSAVDADIQHALQGVDFPLEYRAEVLGDYAERGATMRRLLSYTIIAVVGIFLLLQAAFASWRLAGLIFLMMPAAIAGGLVAAFADGGVMSFGALVGLLAGLGISAHYAIMLIRRFQQLQQEEGERLGPALVLRGVRDRFPLIVTTSLATGLALLPLAVIGPVPGNEIVHPMALVIIGGLITTTLLILFVVPALYLWLAPHPELAKTSTLLQPGFAVSGASD